MARVVATKLSNLPPMIDEVAMAKLESMNRDIAIRHSPSEGPNKVYGYGNNSSSQLGVTSTTTKSWQPLTSVPAIQQLGNIRQIACGQNFSLVLLGSQMLT